MQLWLRNTGFPLAGVWLGFFDCRLTPPAGRLYWPILNPVSADGLSPDRLTKSAGRWV